MVILHFCSANGNVRNLQSCRSELVLQRLLCYFGFQKGKNLSDLNQAILRISNAVANINPQEKLAFILNNISPHIILFKLDLHINSHDMVLRKNWAPLECTNFKRIIHRKRKKKSSILKEPLKVVAKISKLYSPPLIIVIVSILFSKNVFTCVIMKKHQK